MFWLTPVFLKDVWADGAHVYLVYAGGHAFTSTARRLAGVLIFDDVARKTTYTDLEVQGISEVHWRDI
jgi:hypothetical protein